MDAVTYVNILEGTLIPFVREVFPEGYSCKTTILSIRRTMLRNIFCHREYTGGRPLPNLPTVTKLWHELKEFLKHKVKPRTKDELVQGILQFWDTVDVAKCTRYIRHLRKVLPRITELNGDATGY